MQKRELLSLIGKLSFATKVVPAGRIFLRRLIEAATKAKQLHHHVQITRDARNDIAWWKWFLPVWQGVSLFIHQRWTEASTLQLYTDAAGAIGYGAFFQGAWISGPWLPHQRLGAPGISIAWQELYAIVIAAWTWASQLAGKRIRFRTDNQAIVHAWAEARSRDPKIMQLIRVLYLLSALHSFAVRLSHIPGVANIIADSLSRQQFARFRLAAPNADAMPTPVPEQFASLGLDTCSLDVILQSQLTRTTPTMRN